MSFLSALFGEKTNCNGSVVILDPVDYKEALRKAKVQLVDVRTAREFNTGHIPDAMNLDIFQGKSFQSAMAKMDMHKPIYVYCQSGVRSQKAARKLVKMGFKKIYDLKGGYLAWTKH